MSWKSRLRSKHGALERQMPYLLSAVRIQLDRRLAVLGDLALSHDEFLELFVAPEHRRGFMEVAQLVNDDYTRIGRVMYELELYGVVALEITLKELDGIKPPFLPSSVTGCIIPLGELCVPVTSEVTGCNARICSWTKDRYELGLEFGRVKRVLEQLNKRLRTPEQVRYYLPAIRTLCKEHPSLQDFANEIAEVKCARPPPLPVELRDACRVVAATITASSLIETTERIQKHYPVQLQFLYAPERPSPIGQIEVM